MISTYSRQPSLFLVILFLLIRREENGQFGSGRAGLGSIQNPNLVLCSVSQLEREKGKGKLYCGNNTFLRGVYARAR